MAIRVLSFDFDGCLFHSNYIFSEQKDVVKSNHAFLNKIKEENKEFTKAYTFVGSNRQSFAIDIINSRSKGSCFPAVKQVSDFLGTTLDTMLLADIYGDLPDGTSYARATNQNNQEKHSEWLFDETKATILYAQMHKIANENPNEEIVFDFYDDRGIGAIKPVDILEHLHNFYEKNQYLIPSNVTLRLHQYAGAEVTPIAQIKGTGFIDQNYRQTVKDLAAQAVTEFSDGINSQIQVTETAKPELLKNRKPLGKATASAVPEVPVVPKVPDVKEVKDVKIESRETIQTGALNPIQVDDGASKQTPIPSKEAQAAKAKFDAAMKAIEQKSNDLHAKSLRLYTNRLPQNKQSKAYYSYNKAATAAFNLHKAIREASEAYSNNHDKQAFEKAIKEATDIANNSELKNHRGYLKQILGYTGLAVLALLSVATCGLAYVVAGSVNYAINRQFFFSTRINTDSINKVLDIKEAALELITSPTV